MTKPSGSKRGQQPDGNIVWLLNRNGGEIIATNLEKTIVGMLVRANKPAKVGEVQKALTRLAKARGTKVVSEDLGKGSFKLKLVLVNK